MLLLVIIEHVGIIPSYLRDSLYCVGTAAMPMYFALSGFLFSDKKAPSSFYWGKVRTLLIPYLAISFLLVLFDPNIYSNGGSEYFKSEIYRIVVQGVSASKGTPMWFVLSLFIICCLFYIVVKLSSNLAFLFAFAIVTAITATALSSAHMSLILNLESVIAAMPFFIFGYIVKQKNLQHVFFITGGGKRMQFGLAILAFIISVMMYYLLPQGIMFHANIPNILSFYGTGLAFIVAFYALFISCSIKTYFLRFIALNGMTFLGFHAYVQLGVSAVCEIRGISAHLNFYLSLASSLIFCYILSLILNKYAPHIVGKREAKLFKKTICNL